MASIDIASDSNLSRVASALEIMATGGSYSAITATDELDVPVVNGTTLVNWEEGNTDTETSINVSYKSTATGAMTLLLKNATETSRTVSIVTVNNFPNEGDSITNTITLHQGDCYAITCVCEHANQGVYISNIFNCKSSGVFYSNAD